jgi:hypothetical protein
MMMSSINSSGQWADATNAFLRPAYIIGNIQWSPDKQHVAFTVASNNGQATAIELLDLSIGQQKSFAVNNHRP